MLSIFMMMIEMIMMMTNGRTFYNLLISPSFLEHLKKIFTLNKQNQFKIP